MQKQNGKVRKKMRPSGACCLPAVRSDAVVIGAAVKASPSRQGEGKDERGMGSKSGRKRCSPHVTACCGSGTGQMTTALPSWCRGVLPVGCGGVGTVGLAGPGVPALCRGAAPCLAQSLLLVLSAPDRARGIPLPTRARNPRGARPGRSC